jgi:hypothetical protein
LTAGNKLLEKIKKARQLLEKEGEKAGSELKFSNAPPAEAFRA